MKVDKQGGTEYINVDNWVEITISELSLVSPNWCVQVKK